MTVTMCHDNAVARHLAVDAHRARQCRPAEAELDNYLTLPGGQQPDASLDEVSVRAAIATRGTWLAGARFPGLAREKVHLPNEQWRVPRRADPRLGPLTPIPDLRRRPD